MQTPNAQGIAGLMSQGRAPQPPQQQPQQAMPSPMKASPMASIGSVEDRVSAYRGNPAPLQQRYAMSQDLLDLLALQQIKSEKENAARQMQMQMAQQQAAQGAGEMTVAQQREKEVMELTKNELAQQRGDTAQQQVGEQQANLQKVMSGGIARAPGAQTVAQPKMMAAGGIVAFNGTQGSDVNLSPAQVRQKLAEAVRNRDVEKADFYRKWLETNSMPERPQAPRIVIPRGLRDPVRQESGVVNVPPAAQAITPAEADAGLERRLAPPATAPAATPGAGGPAAVRPGTGDPAAAARPGAGGPAATPPRLPTGPAAPAAPEIKYNAPTMGEVSMIPGVEKSIQQDVSRDPLAMQREQEDRIRKMYDLTPEQRKVYEEGIAQRRQMFDQAYNPERMRREGIKQFLLGAGGRRYGEFGGGASAAKAYDEGARAQRRKDFEDLQKSREGLIGLERAGIDPSVKAGLEGLKAGSEMRRTGQTAGANIYGTDTSAATSKFATETSGANTQYSSQMAARTADLDRKVNEMKATLQAEANRISSGAADQNRAQAIYSNTMGKVRTLLQDMDEQFNKRPDIGMLLMKDPKSLTPEEKNRLDLAQAQHELAKRNLKREVEAELKPIQAKLGMGSATEGWGQLGEKKK